MLWRRCIRDRCVFQFKRFTLFGSLLADPLKLLRTLRHDCPFREDWRGVRRGDCKASVNQMSGEFRLRVLIRILAVEVGCSYEGAFLFPMSVVATEFGSKSSYYLRWGVIPRIQ